MDTMIAYCGMNCTNCPTFKATQLDDDNERQKVVKLWSKMFGIELKVSDINCDGCLTETGRIFGHCNDCAVRACGQEKGVENCAYCTDYSCEKLDTQLSNIPIPDPRKTLESLRAKG